LLALKGVSVDHRVVAQFMENLGKRPIFSAVELISSTSAAVGGGSAAASTGVPLKQFQLTCRVNPLKEKPKE
jgi:hypothetical protein